MLVQRQEAEQDLNQRLQKVQIDKQAAAECAATLQRTLAALDAEKRDAERSALRLQKDKSALKKTLDKVSVTTSLNVWCTSACGSI
jgi:rootletin